MTEDVQRWEQRHPEANVKPTVPTANEIMMQAVRNGLGKEQLEVLERMLELDIKVKAQQAKEAFFSAMARFHKNKPAVKKDKYNKFFDSHYTSLENLLNTFSGPLAEEGLSLSFPAPQQTETSMTVTCRVNHELGHHEDFSISGPVDVAAVGKQSGQRSRNPLQDVKSTFTYLRSASVEAALGVAGTNATSDDDGNNAQNGEPLNDQQFSDIKALITEVGANEDAFCKYLKIESIDKMPESLYERAVKELMRKRK